MLRKIFSNVHFSISQNQIYCRVIIVAFSSNFFEGVAHRVEKEGLAGVLVGNLPKTDPKERIWGK
jgi:hypothetical protein